MVVYVQEPLVGGKTTTHFFLFIFSLLYFDIQDEYGAKTTQTAFKKSLNDLQSSWQVCLYFTSNNGEGAKHHKHHQTC
jgi:hypothetical protein